MSENGRRQRLLERLVERLEHAKALDPISEALAKPLRPALQVGPVEDVASGTALGHPVHPLLTDVPIGAWTSALMLDLLGNNRRAARRLLTLGVVAAVPTAVTGASDWLSTAGAERRVGLVHAAANYLGLGLQTASLMVRRQGRERLGVVLSVAAMGAVGAGGYLGGHLAYALGVGVDTTTFQELPAEWTDVAAADDIHEDPTLAHVGATPVVLFRTTSGVVALADRCTHRGGPLHEGSRSGDCLTCPWHGSVFDSDGTVRSGPATRPQPAFEVRVRDGRVEIRRSEERTLRMNPVGG